MAAAAVITRPVSIRPSQAASASFSSVHSSWIRETRKTSESVARPKTFANIDTGTNASIGPGERCRGTAEPEDGAADPGEAAIESGFISAARSGIRSEPKTTGAHVRVRQPAAGE